MLGSHVLVPPYAGGTTAGDLAAADRYAELAGLTALEHLSALVVPVPVENVLRSSGACAVAACCMVSGREALPSLDLLRQAAVRQDREAV